MRIAIRADASTSIGTGHVMRQIALAQYLLSSNHEVTLFASITGPDWLRKYVDSQSGLLWVEVEEGDFSVDDLLAGGRLDALVIDAYTLNQKALQLLEKAIPTVAVIVDGPWQDVSGKLAIVPTLDRNPAWASEYKKLFQEIHSGPDFFMLRREVIEARRKRSRRPPNSKARIVVALGGSDIGGKTVQIAETLASIFPSAEIDAYAPGVVSVASEKTKNGGTVSFHPSGPEFIDKLALADFAVVGAGTTVAEAIFIQVPAIFLAVAENQSANHAFLEDAKYGTSLVLTSVTFEKDLVEALNSFRILIPGVTVTSEPAHQPFDGKGAEQVARLITNRAGV